ncbi:hypothetical protein HDV03_005202 [Kappamyces sp. JEL0829]|nr:hypothetical protein HDV03_005202 [Kappamyces sp. JEL0829]
MRSHAREKQHAFLMDFNNCNVWCCQCKTYIYDDVLDKILFAEQYFLDYIVSRVREPFVVRPLYPLWKPTLAEAEKIKEHSKVVRCTGMRGLRNLGNTCFMNSYERGGLMRRILQALIHNPLLKAHFLSDKHSVASCTSTSGFCMACQLDKLYSQFYSLDTTAFAPHACLHAMWISQTHMAGYSQQDAHEFFISFLDEIHKCSSTKPDGIKQDPCRCIIHQVFGGVLQSDVTCTSCNFVSQTLDPILDLSLEIKNVSKKKNHEISLGDCLEDFTQPEKLAAYTCKKCNMAREATKQLSIKTLPPVLSIQLKRFEHNEKSSSKIESFVKISSTLDMTPLTTRSVRMKTILQQSSKAKSPRNIPFDSVVDGVPSYKYSLFAVINHEGKLDTGHYKAYCRVRDGWYQFDDHNITEVNLSQVLKCNSYMCFYVRDHVEYVPSERPAVLSDGDVIMLDQ